MGNSPFEIFLVLMVFFGTIIAGAVAIFLAVEKLRRPR